MLPFDFTIDHLLGSKMGLVGYISREQKQKAVNISAYDEQFIAAKLDLIKRGAKRFLLNAENYIDFAARNPLLKQASNTPNSINKLGSEFAPRNPEYSAITEYDNTIRSRKQLPNNLNNFQRIANKFQSVLMMSNSDDETLMQISTQHPQKSDTRTKQVHQRLPQYKQHPQLPILIPQRSRRHLLMIFTQMPSILRYPKSFQAP